MGPESIWSPHRCGSVGCAVCAVCMFVCFWWGAERSHAARAVAVLLARVAARSAVHFLGVLEGSVGPLLWSGVLWYCSMCGGVPFRRPGGLKQGKLHHSLHSPVLQGERQLCWCLSWIIFTPSAAQFSRQGHRMLVACASNPAVNSCVRNCFAVVVVVGICSNGVLKCTCKHCVCVLYPATVVGDIRCPSSERHCIMAICRSPAGFALIYSTVTCCPDACTSAD